MFKFNYIVPVVWTQAVFCQDFPPNQWKHLNHCTVLLYVFSDNGPKIYQYAIDPGKISFARGEIGCNLSSYLGVSPVEHNDTCFWADMHKFALTAWLLFKNLSESNVLAQGDTEHSDFKELKTEAWSNIKWTREFFKKSYEYSCGKSCCCKSHFFKKACMLYASTWKLHN